MTIGKQAVLNCDDIQFYWTMLSVDIVDENHAIQLLKEVIGLWISVRGFSIAGVWLEEYKQVCTSKSTALRKDLKYKSTSSTSENS